MKTAWTLMAILALAACDRRDDPAVDRASTANPAPSGQRTDARADEDVLAPAPEDTIPVSTRPPPALHECDGKDGDVLNACLREQSQKEPAPAPPRTPSR